MEPTYAEKAAMCRKAAERASSPVIAEAFTEAAHYFSNKSTGVVLLMRDENAYSQQVMCDAAVVIDRDGTVIKNRHGYAGIDAGEELLTAATPVWPEVRGRVKGLSLVERASVERTYRWEISSGSILCFAKLVIEQDAPGAPLEDTMAPIEETVHGFGGSLGYLYVAFSLAGLRRKIARHERREGFVGEEVFL